MKKITFFVLLVSVLTACSNNNAQQIEQAEERARITKDSLQSIKDSLDVEAKILKDMESDADSSASQ
ncbi:MAG: hypothetical protein V4613_06370 [Bacteroidota bacterium]